MPSLERLDVVVAGACSGPDDRRRIDAVVELRQRATFESRAAGASLHDRSLAPPLVNGELVDVVCLRYNPAHAGARRDVFAQLARTRTLVYGFNAASRGVLHGRDGAVAALAADVWRPRVVDYYRFALTVPELDGLLCSPQTPAQVAELCAAMCDGPLDDEDLEHLQLLELVAAGGARLG